MLTRFTVEGAHKHSPKVDRTRDIIELNNRIVQFNQDAPQQPWQTAHAPSTFQTFGVKFRKDYSGQPREPMELASGHRYPQWHKATKKKKLHLSNKKRRQMGRATLNYFRLLYDIRGTKARA